MGICDSKEEKEAKKFINDLKAVKDPRYISYDSNGNLVYGLVHPVSRIKQLREVLALDFIDEVEGKVWYIIDTAWINSWLAYVHGNKEISPCPGPCRNDRLITYDYENDAYVGRYGLLMTMKNKDGDYRRIGKDVWKLIQKYYPGSGPTIKMTYHQTDMKGIGVFDTSLWVIEDPPEPPADAKKKKISKKKLHEIEVQKSERDNELSELQAEQSSMDLGDIYNTPHSSLFNDNENLKENEEINQQVNDSFNQFTRQGEAVDSDDDDYVPTNNYKDSSTTLSIQLDKTSKFKSNNPIALKSVLNSDYKLNSTNDSKNTKQSDFTDFLSLQD